MTDELLIKLARRQGARAGRFGSGPATNPFVAGGAPADAWETARREVVGDQLTLGLDAAESPNLEELQSV